MRLVGSEIHESRTAECERETITRDRRPVLGDEGLSKNRQSGTNKAQSGTYWLSTGSSL